MPDELNTTAYGAHDYTPEECKMAKSLWDASGRKFRDSNTWMTFLPEAREISQAKYTTGFWAKRYPRERALFDWLDLGAAAMGGFALAVMGAGAIVMTLCQVFR